LKFDAVSEPFKMRRDEASDLKLLARDGGNVNQPSRQLEKVHGRKMQNDECGVMNDEGHAAFNSSFIIPHSSFLKSVSADLREQFGGGALEEGFVEAAHGVGGVALLDDEGQVDGGRALRDQEHV